jgi:hypothetical protein
MYRFLIFYDATPTILTDISAFGHVVCKYELDKENKRITPSKIEKRTNCVTDVAPRARWDLDLTTAEGAARIQAIFREVKNVKLNKGAYKYNFAVPKSKTFADMCKVGFAISIDATAGLYMSVVVHHIKKDKNRLV